MINKCINIYDILQLHYEKNDFAIVSKNLVTQ